jgi:hypothetical protein
MSYRAIQKKHINPDNLKSKKKKEVQSALEENVEHFDN